MKKLAANNVGGHPDARGYMLPRLFEAKVKTATWVGITGHSSADAYDAQFLPMVVGLMATMTPIRPCQS